MFCGKCGNEIKEGENFCSKCGASVNNKNSTINTNVNKDPVQVDMKKYAKIVLIGIPILVIALLGLSFWITNASRPSLDNNASLSELKEPDKHTNINTSSEITDTTSQSNQLSLNDIQMNTKFTSLNDMNKVTEKIVSCAWQYVKGKYPNAKWNYCKIYSQDGYGRYNLTVDFVKSSTSEQASRESVIVWVKDINTDDMGYYYDYNMTYLNEWGKPLPSNIGE